MKTLQFSTTINCSGCVAAITPTLNQVSEIKSWSVNTSAPDKLLTVETNLDQQQVVAIVQKAGFQAKPLQV